MFQKSVTFAYVYCWINRLYLNICRSRPHNTAFLIISSTQQFLCIPLCGHISRVQIFNKGFANIRFKLKMHHSNRSPKYTCTVSNAIYISLSRRDPSSFAARQTTVPTMEKNKPCFYYHLSYEYTSSTRVPYFDRRSSLCHPNYVNRTSRVRKTLANIRPCVFRPGA